MARFGVPLRLTTDQGAQLESKLFTELNKLLGTQKLRTTAYHPQANGMIERWHRSLKNAIKCHAKSRWMESLPIILLGLRSVILESITASPAELVYGTTLRLPYQYFEQSKPDVSSDPNIFVERLKEKMNNLIPVPSSNHNKQQVFVHKGMDSCTHVFIRHDGVRKSLQPTYEGPFEVISKNSKYFTVNVKGKIKPITIDRLKPMFTAVISNIKLQPPTLLKKEVHFSLNN